MTDAELLMLAKNVQRFLETGTEINPEALRYIITDYIQIKQDMIDAKSEEEFHKRPKLWKLVDSITDENRHPEA